MTVTEPRPLRGSIPPAPETFAGWDEHFDAYADEYESIAFAGAGLGYVSKREIKAVVDVLGSRPAGNVLDAGAGTGRMARELAWRRWDVTAVDVSSRMLAGLRDRLPMCTTVEGTIGTPLPLADATFDAVLCMRVLKYVDDLDTALREFARVLRPGGLAVLEWTNARSAARFGYPGAPIRFATVRAAEDAMRRAGLTPIRRIAGTRLPQPVWTRAESTRSARTAIGAERGLAALCGGDRTCAGARSFLLVGARM